MGHCMELKTNHHQEHIAPVPDDSEGEVVPISRYPCDLYGQQTPAETTNWQ